VANNNQVWVPEDQRTTAWYLFNKMFRCRVGNLDSMSADYVRYYGMPTSGDPAYDEQVAKELVDRYLTIDDMMAYAKRGVAVEVNKPEDTKVIYEIISNHLVAWKNQLEHQLGKPDPELVEDLIRMDNFANIIYAHAKYHFAPDTLDSAFARNISSLLSISNANLLAKPAEPVDPNATPEEAEAAKFPERQSFRDVFISRAAAPVNGPGRWK